MKNTKNSFFRAFVFLVLFSSLFFAGPEYVGCEDLDSDNWLDLFVIPQNSEVSAIIRKDLPLIRIFSNLYSKTHSIPCCPSGNLRPQPFTSELVPSVSLRC